MSRRILCLLIATCAILTSAQVTGPTGPSAALAADSCTKEGTITVGANVVNGVKCDVGFTCQDGEYIWIKVENLEADDRKLRGRAECGVGGNVACGRTVTNTSPCYDISATPTKGNDQAASSTCFATALEGFDADFSEARVRVTCWSERRRRPRTDCPLYRGRLTSTGFGILSNTGTYVSEMTATCVVTVTDAALEDTQPAVHDVSLTFQGTFNNVLCGTATFSSIVEDVTAVTQTGGSEDLISIWEDIDLSHEMYTLAAKGVLVFTGEGVDAGGVVEMMDPTPEEINVPPGTCTTDFEISGTIAGQFP